MSKPRLEIIVLFQNLGEDDPYYAKSPAPPLSGALLAALTPDLVDITLRHEMIRPIDYDIDADFVALSFMDYCAPHAIRVAQRFRSRGKVVIAGGRYASTFPNALLPHFDAVVCGEAEPVWAEVVNDLVHGRLRKLYRAPLACLDNIPPPRYDLVEPAFSVPVVTEATRGCPFHCTYCQLTIQDAPFRTRPIGDVIRDLTATQKIPWLKRRMAMLYDNNLGGNIGYAKELLQEIAGLDLWAVGVQFSLNNLRDREFVDLLEKARCRMAFLGMESMSDESLAGVNKTHNRVAEYRDRFRDLRQRGILTFAGTIVGLDGDSRAYYDALPAKLEEVDPSAIFLSIAIPIPGTALHGQMERDGRIVEQDLARYDGDHLVFEPRGVAAEDVQKAFRRVNEEFYSWGSIVRRWGRIIRDYLLAGPDRREGDRGAAAPRASFGARLFPALLISIVLFQLSIFQRGHLRRRVRRSVSPGSEPRGAARTAPASERSAAGVP